MEYPDPILEWSKVSSEIELEKRAAKERVLKSHGISKETFKDMYDVVMSIGKDYPGGVLDNEYGQIRWVRVPLKSREGFGETIISRCYIVPKVKTKSNSQ